MKLHEYQTLASSNLLERTRNHFGGDARLTDLYLKAITGSGKTVIMADYIERVFEEYKNKKNVAIVWMTIGTGGLHEQSYNSLKGNLSSDINLYTSDTFRSQESLSHRDVLVLNWESVHTMDIDDPENPVYHNLIMKDGEQISIPKLFENTHSDNTEIVMIIDEAHIGAENRKTKDVQRTQIIKKEINPIAVVNVTATPKMPKEIDPRDFIEVDTRSVIREGRIKKNVIISDDMDDSEDDQTFIEWILNSAINKQEQLKQLYIESGNDHINPLGIIQVPNGKEGDEVTKVVEEVLASRGYTYAQENLALGYGKTINMERIRETDSPVSFVIFKQALSTGWDVPRSQLWIKMRNIGSVTFDAQTLGRVLRMPEGKKVTDPSHPNYKFFEHDDLNNAYVYTDRNYSVSTSDYKTIFPTSKQLKSDLLADVKNTVLIKETIDKPDVRITDEEVSREINKLVNDNKDTLVPEEELTFTIDVSFGEYTAYDLETEETIIEKQHREVTSKADIEFYSNRYLDKLVKNDINRDVLFYSIHEELRQVYGDTNFLALRKWILINRHLLTETVNTLRQRKNRDASSRAEIITSDFYIPETVLVNQKYEGEVFEKSAYVKQPLVSDKSAPERGFEVQIDGLDNVKWWVKNQDNGAKALSIVYEVNETDTKYRLFNPDYIIKFNDGTVGIYEVKSVHDLRPDNTVQKELAFSPYLQRLNRQTEFNVVGGIVYLEEDKRSGLHVIKDDRNNYPELQ